MGDNPLFYFCNFSFIWVKELAYFCNYSFVSLFYRIVVPSKVLYWKVDARFGFLRSDRFLAVTDLSLSHCRKFQKFWKTSRIFLRYVRNFHYFRSDPSEQFKCLEKIRHSRLFCFWQVCLLVCIRSFTVFVWISLLHKASVAVANVQRL